MRKIPLAKQMREADAYTIAHEPIASVDLMERASRAFVERLLTVLPLPQYSVLICCGTGNNGGDGLAIGRLLYEHGICDITIWIVAYNVHSTADFLTNYQRIKQLNVPVQEFQPSDKLPEIRQDLIIDALLGSGLNKPLSGAWVDLVDHLNRAGKKIVAVDIPTGMPADGHIDPNAASIIADEVITFQRAKWSFLFPESAPLMKGFHVVDIGLDEDFIESLSGDLMEVTEDDICRIYKERRPFSHKGTYGHALLIAGNEQTMGAALLAGEACLFTGAGLTSLSIPHSGFIAMNTRLPEVMLAPRDQGIAMEKFNALAVGPGLGKGETEIQLVKHLLLQDKLPPLILDADALNILAGEQILLDRLPANTVLTPHMKEFDRLFGESKSWIDRVLLAQAEARRKKLVIVLKNRFTFIAVPDGKIYVNFTGNPGMAIGGMGDTLTGILVSLLAQGYTPHEAAILGCYIHGKAGDVLAAEGMAVIPPSVLIQKIPNVIKKLKR